MLLVLILAAQLAPPSCSTRAGCEGAVNAVIHAFDTDRDGQLSQSEWTAMGDGKLSGLPAPRDEIERLRREIADDFRLEDRNADGYLTGDEMLGARLAAFPCIDRHRKICTFPPASTIEFVSRPTRTNHSFFGG